MSGGEEVERPSEPVKAVPFEPVRASDGSIDVEATVAVADQHFARASLRYRLSPFRRKHRAYWRASLGRLTR